MKIIDITTKTKQGEPSLKEMIGIGIEIEIGIETETGMTIVGTGTEIGIVIGTGMMIDGIAIEIGTGTETDIEDNISSSYGRGQGYNNSVRVLLFSGSCQTNLMIHLE